MSSPLHFSEEILRGWLNLFCPSKFYSVPLSLFLALYFFYQISIPNNKLMLRAKSAYMYSTEYVFQNLKSYKESNSSLIFLFRSSL